MCWAIGSSSRCRGRFWCSSRSIDRSDLVGVNWSPSVAITCSVNGLSMPSSISLRGNRFLS